MSKPRDIYPLMVRAPIFVDTPGDPKLIERKKGERLNFLFSQLQQARTGGDPEIIKAANEAFFTEVFDYCGVPGRKEADRHRNHLPGSDSPKDPLDELYGREWREEIATRVFLKLDKFKGKSSFQTWVYRVITNELADLIEERKKHRHLEIFEWSKNCGVDAEGKPIGDEVHNVNIAEERFVNTFGELADAAEESPVLKGKTPEQVQAAYEAADKLFAAQSKENQSFLIYKWGKDSAAYRAAGVAAPGQEKVKLSAESMAVLLNWSIKKVYNRTAKFRKLGLLPATTPNLQKREYNRRARLKLAKSKSGGLSSEEQGREGSALAC
jgi:hypothetical protein